MSVLNLPVPCTVNGLGLRLVDSSSNLSEKDVVAVYTDVPGDGEARAIVEVRTSEEDVDVED